MTVVDRLSQLCVRLYVVAGSAMLGLLIALYIGRPSVLFLALGSVLALTVLACDAWIIARREWITGGIALVSQFALLIFVGNYAASPLPAPSPISDPLPPASPPGGMAIYALPTGVNHRTAAFAYRGEKGARGSRQNKSVRILSRFKSRCFA